MLAEDRDRSCEEPVQLRECYRRCLMLGEVLLDELGEGERPRDPVCLS
jgi:hypothetical protein